MKKSSTLVIIVFALVWIMVLSIPCGNGVSMALAENKTITLTMGEGSKQIYLTFETGSMKTTGEKDRYKLSGAIRDFSIPTNQLGKPLTRNLVNGEEVINEIEIQTGGGQTAMIFRLSTKGTGGGEGNLGVSLVVAANLDSLVVKPKKKATFIVPSEGKLIEAGGKISSVAEYISKDLDAINAKSDIYTKLAGAGTFDTHFLGFAIFDPTNPESIGNAYFEFSSSESTLAWHLE